MSLIVKDADAIYARAKDAGATIVEDIFRKLQFVSAMPTGNDDHTAATGQFFRTIHLAAQ